MNDDTRRGEVPIPTSQRPRRNLILRRVSTEPLVPDVLNQAMKNELLPQDRHASMDM